MLSDSLRTVSRGFSCNKSISIAFVLLIAEEKLEETAMISAKVELNQSLRQQRQFVAQTGSGHHLLLDDTAGGTGPKPIELVAAALAGCTAFDVITILRQKYHQKVTGYEVRVEADQADRPPQVFTAVRIHHLVTGYEIDPAALEQAIRLSEEKYCSVGAMVQKTATFHTTYEIVEDKTEWMKPAHSDSNSELNLMKRETISAAGAIFPELRSAFHLVIPLVILGMLPFWSSVSASSQQATEPSPLTLQQAIHVALEKNPLRKAALADTRVASADIREARSVLMPRLTFSETATRGNDPIYVFGSKLRQQRFATSDFALNQLNTPLPFGNFSTRFAGSWNLFDSFASWHGVNRAKQMNQASRASVGAYGPGNCLPRCQCLLRRSAGGQATSGCGASGQDRPVDHGT